MKITLDVPPSANRYVASTRVVCYNYTRSNRIVDRGATSIALGLSKSFTEELTMMYSTPVVARCQVGESPLSIPKASGIYLLRNRISGGFYVGSTRNLRRRYHQHASCLRGQYHHNPKLREAWLLYGAPYRKG